MKKFNLIISTVIISLFIVTSISAQENQESPLKDQTWVRLGGPQGGLGYDIKIDPNDTNIMYVTDANAGIHKSINGGESWFSINEGINNRTGSTGEIIPTFSITIDPNNSQNLWVGLTGGGGIYKSVDGGSTWIQKVNGINTRNITFRGFSIDPTDSNIVYAAGEIPSYIWSGTEQRGLFFDKTKGVVYQSGNGGDSWTKIWVGNNLARYVLINPEDTNILYISTGIFDREAANTDVENEIPGGVGVVRSKDGGETWEVLNQKNGLNGLYVGSLFMHPENPNILLAGVGDDVWSRLYWEKSPAGIYMSKDGGDSWYAVLEERDGNIMSVEYCLSDPSIAYAAGDYNFYRSEDSGETWTKTNIGQGHWGAPDVIGSQPIDIQCHPEDPNKLFVNNYSGGNFLSTDGGYSWITASAGYSGAEITGDITVDPANSARLIVGAKSGLFVSENGGKNWSGLAFHPARYNNLYAHAISPYNFNSIISAPWDLYGVAVSDEAGKSWKTFSSGLLNNRIEFGFGIFLLKIAPSNSDTVYAVLSDCGGNRVENRSNCINIEDSVFLSRNFGEDWKSISNEELSKNHVISMAVHPENEEIIFVGTGLGGIYYTDNQGNSWEPKNNNISSYRVTTIEFNPINPRVVFMGTSNNGLYRSENVGDSWSRLYKGLPNNLIITDLVIDQANPNNIWFSSINSGIFLSKDGGNTWQGVNEGLSIKSVTFLGLSSDGATLYAGTRSGGVFRLSIHDQSYFDELALQFAPTSTPISSSTNEPTKLPNTEDNATSDVAPDPTSLPAESLDEQALNEQGEISPTVLTAISAGILVVLIVLILLRRKNEK